MTQLTITNTGTATATNSASSFENLFGDLKALRKDANKADARVQRLLDMGNQFSAPSKIMTLKTIAAFSAFKMAVETTRIIFNARLASATNPKDLIAAIKQYTVDMNKAADNFSKVL